ncbi:hypothetical protein G7K_6333-t1 [Saitoella complicata NRRL Y-17804]|uniref:Uncharacterized protein n=1 Tax=Saitoella complicata (strain BCRC 22490 / CBS 7301 / JCM 7358 / NBRC 10748 / NRRL Y-17804) TaxID=698492 RepID=A0A0E9NQU7_SAICN|nr:hypothetical protein G7K_6333-t1 [Saitoella complicata NRRL Y-17804]
MFFLFDLLGSWMRICTSIIRDIPGVTVRHTRAFYMILWIRVIGYTQIIFLITVLKLPFISPLDVLCNDMLS